jgi:hypothetical protein
MSETDAGFLAALEEGKKGATEGGVPIGACLVSKDGKILGQGHNMRVQNGSAILHVSTHPPRPPGEASRASVIVSLAMDSRAPSPKFLGRDVGAAELWAPTRDSVRGSDNVHDALAVRHVHGSMHPVQGPACRHRREQDVRRRGEVFKGARCRSRRAGK